MKKAKTGEKTLKAEYKLQSLRVRKLGPARKRFGEIVRLDSDVAKAFPSAELVNNALRSLIPAAKEMKRVPRSAGRNV